jgi:hypothetical protein
MIVIRINGIQKNSPFVLWSSQNALASFAITLFNEEA